MSALQKWNPFRGSSLWVPNREVEKILNRMASVLGRNHRMFRPLLVIAFTLQLAGASAAADSVSDFATGLQFPVKLLLTDQGNLLVSEAGPAPNTGRISIVNRHGVRRSLMEGLASGGHASADGPPLGPAGLVLRGRILYVCNGDGGLIVPGVVARTQAPNPAGPPSPLSSTILKIRLSSDVDAIQFGFALTPAHHTTLGEGQVVTLINAAGDRAEIEIHAAFRPYVRDPFLAVRQSNPHALIMWRGEEEMWRGEGEDDDEEGQSFYVADAGMDALVKVDTKTGRMQTFVKFPRILNPSGGTLDSVPNSIRLFGDEALVSLMGGVPFPPGLARVRAVNLRTGAIRPVIDGLTASIDVLPQKLKGNRDRIFTLEFFLGRLMRFDSGVGTQVAGGLTTPTAMAQDPNTGDLFVTEFATGKILRVPVP